MTILIKSQSQRAIVYDLGKGRCIPLLMLLCQEVYMYAGSTAAELLGLEISLPVEDEDCTVLVRSSDVYT